MTRTVVVLPGEAALKDLLSAVVGAEVVIEPAVAPPAAGPAPSAKTTASQ